MRTEHSSYGPEAHGGAFTATHWSVILAAGQADSPQATSAAEQLCRTYWYPLDAYIRRRGLGHEDAQDLTHVLPPGSGRAINPSVLANRFSCDVWTPLDVRPGVTGLNEVGAEFCPSTAPGNLTCSPGSGLPGTTVSLSGTNLSGATTVLFNGLNAQFTPGPDPDKEVVATVPAHATTGPVTVITSLGNITSLTPFTVPVPLAMSLQPGGKTCLRWPRLYSLNRVDNLNSVRQISLTMKTATVRDLRNHFPRVAAWIEEGEPVEITRAGKLFARMLPAAPAKPRRFKMPDVMTRLNRTFGETCYDAEDLARGLAASRGDLS
ncbi:MAG TPA: hypothetical protein VJA21_26065 [Verrucomicrobiae bacterium]